jgi:hypothetical protein
MIHPEVSEATLELITVRYEAGLVPDRRRRDRSEFDFDRPAPAATDDVKAGVHGQAVKPGIEAVRVAQAREVAPRSDVGVLDRVAGEFLVPQNQARDRLQPRDRPADEPPEGVMIASACPFDEIPLVHGHPRDATISAVFKGTGVGNSQTIPSLAPRRPQGAADRVASIAPSGRSCAVCAVS